MLKTSRAKSGDGPAERPAEHDRGLGGFVRRRGLVSFYALAFGLTWLAWLPAGAPRGDPRRRARQGHLAKTRSAAPDGVFDRGRLACRDCAARRGRRKTNVPRTGEYGRHKEKRT